MPGLTWNTEKRVRFLGQAEEECKKDVPTGLDQDTLKAYAERCGTAVALDWVSKETGVDVKGCNKSKAGDAAECVANNYGITLDIIEDGKINWDNCARDAGAIGGIAVCAATGAGAAAAPICGKIGAEIGKVVGAVVKTVGKAIIEFFFGGDDGGGIACGKSPGGVGPLEMARQIARFMKYGTPASAKPEEMLGPILSATPGYWDRLLKISGLAQASGAVIADFAKKTNTSPAAAARFLKVAGPSGWTEVVRPAFGKVNAKHNWPDYIMNTGGLFAMLYNPRSLEPKTIKPRWQDPAFWTGIEGKDKTEPVVWYYFVTALECPNTITNWGRIDDFEFAKKTLAQKGGENTGKHDWWIYSIPKSVDNFVRMSSDGVFDFAMSVWRSSISNDLEAKMRAARAASSGGGTSVAPLAIGAVIAAVIAWALL